MPSVSVLMPSYQHGRFIGRAIESVLRQDFDDLELIVVDDGSTDDSVAVIRSHSDPRLRLETFDRNRGAAVALNAALEKARGEFVCPIGSDDLFLPGKLALQARFLLDNPGIAAVFGMPRFIDEDGRPLPPTPRRSWYDSFRAAFRERLGSRESWLRRFFLKGNALCHPTAMIRRDALLATGPWDDRLANLLDFDLWVRLCLKFEIHVEDREVTLMRILSDRRNMSAPRRDTKLRSAVEHLFILRHYRSEPIDSLRRIFGAEVGARRGLAEETDPRILLAEIAVASGRPANQLFGLELMFEAAGADRSRSLRLIELSGETDPFGIDPRNEAASLRQQLTEIRAEMARLEGEPDADGDRAAPAPPLGRDTGRSA